MDAMHDDTLTESGWTPDPATLGDGAGKLLLIGCGALARETLAVIEANRLAHVTLTCLPALLHNRPEKIAEAVRARIHQGRFDGFERIFVLYGDCGTGGMLDQVLEEEAVERLPGAHCYAFFDGVEAFAARAEEEIGAFFLTDFLVRQFDALVWRGLGLDRHPSLRDMYFGNYDRVVYLAQTEDPDLDTKAAAAAKRLGLKLERRFTGYGALEGALRARAPALAHDATPTDADDPVSRRP